MIEVSIIIPTYNSDSTLEACLKSIRDNATRYSYEILVCDAHSSDRTVEIAKQYADKVLTGDPQRINRNIGIREAQGSIILFTDSDCLVPRNWIERLVRGLEACHKKNSRIIGVGGGNLPWLDHPTKLEESIAITIRSSLVSFKARNTANYPIDRPVEHNPPINSAYYKRVLVEHGLFDERPGDFPEDLDLDARLTRSGYQLYFLAGIVVKHKHKSTYRAFARQMQHFGANRVKINQKLHFVRKWWHYGPALLCLMLHSPLFFIPVYLATVNAWDSVEKDDFRHIFHIFNLTISFYRNYGLGEIKALIRR